MNKMFTALSCSLFFYLNNFSVEHVIILCAANTGIWILQDGMLLAEEQKWFSTWCEMVLCSNYWSPFCTEHQCRPDIKTSLMKPGKKDYWSRGMETMKVFFQSLWKETTDSCHTLVDMFLFARHTAHSPSACPSQIKFCKLSVLPQLQFLLSEGRH